MKRNYFHLIKYLYKIIKITQIKTYNRYGKEIN